MPSVTSRPPSMRAAFIAAVALVLASGCGGTATPSVPLTPSPILAASPPLVTQSPTTPPTAAPSTNVADAYRMLAEDINFRWSALGSPSDAYLWPPADRLAYSTAWIAIEERIITGIHAIPWSTPAQATEADAIAADAHKVVQVLSVTPGEDLLLSYASTRDQRLAAAAMRKMLDLPVLKLSDPDIL